MSLKTMMSVAFDTLMACVMIFSQESPTIDNGEAA
jgi:hypothetical protein